MGTLILLGIVGIPCTVTHYGFDSPRETLVEIEQDDLACGCENRISTPIKKCPHLGMSQSTIPIYQH